MITAQKIHRGEQYIENPAYLNPIIFTRQFYEPAVNLLGANLTGFIFEQEYQRKEDRAPVVEMARDLDKFFSQISKDTRYHLELRTDLYLRDQVFEVLSKHGIGQILSHWTWLPPLRKQLAKADGRFFNAGLARIYNSNSWKNPSVLFVYKKAHLKISPSLPKLIEQIS